MRKLKDFGRSVVVAILSWQLQRLQARHTIKTVGVAGSYGKTSTKFAIATVLAQHYRIRFQTGNYNDLVSVPLVFFDEQMPSLLNPFAWLLVFARNEWQLRGSYPYDVVILELGTDGPGQLIEFGRYLRLDAAVVTSIALEHMKFFGSLQIVADEELSVQDFCQQLIINTDLCPIGLLGSLAKPSISFGYNQDADYRLQYGGFINNGHVFKIMHEHKFLLETSYRGIAKMQLYSACAATIVGRRLGVPTAKIVAGLDAIVPVKGRSQTLRGIHDSIILDETYNASPEATKAALDALYSFEAPQKIALLGSMNELGSYSEVAHQTIGEYCDPQQLDIVLTLGPDANNYLAPAAREAGCSVKTFDTPYAAGAYLQRHIRENAAILVKGSQNMVFAEEAVKVILADPKDAALLVRQSPAWLKRKATIFAKNK